MSEPQPSEHLRSPRPFPRTWVIISYVLAGLYLASVCASVVIQRRLNADYRRSSEQSRAWAGRIKHYVKFGQQAATIDAAAASEVGSTNVEAGEKVAREAREAFERQLEEAQADVGSNVGGADGAKLRTDLNVLKTSMDDLSNQAETLFPTRVKRTPAR